MKCGEVDLMFSFENNHVVEVYPIEKHIILLHNTFLILHFPRDYGKIKPPFS
jgi:hypothetical protein